MRPNEMNQPLNRSADVRTTPSHLRPIEDDLDRLADQERLSAPTGLEDRVQDASAPLLRAAESVSMPVESEPPVVLFRFTSLRAAAAIGLLATVSAVWLAIQSGNMSGGNIEPDMDDWDQFASLSFPPLDYTSDDLFADTEQFTISLTAEMIDSEPLFEEDSM